MFALAVSAMAGAQALPKLDEPIAIDVHIQDFRWNHAGDGLLYRRVTDKGIGLGTYFEGQKDGKVLLEVGKDDQVEWDWFAFAPIAIVVVYKFDPETKQKTGAYEIYELDAKNRNVYVLHKGFSDPTKSIEVNIDLSPSLVHGIFRIQSGEDTKHWILPTGKRALSPAPDIDKAVSAGLSGPLWASDGSAIYGQGIGSANNGALEAVIRLRTDQALAKQGSPPVLSEIPLLSTLFVNEGGGVFTLSPKAPEVGTVVNNVIPSNGGIVTVRFKGSFVPRAIKSVDVIVKPSEDFYVFGKSKETGSSLWLADADKKPTSGILVSPRFDEVAVSNFGKFIGFTVDGALFVRRIRG